MQKKYEDRGLVVVAVNGWDEPRDAVASYVERESLAQTVLLMGSEVAADKFGVKSYPTNFLVDREGRVVVHDVGFDPVLVEALEREIVRELATPAR